MAAMLVARFGGDVDLLTQAYDRAHSLIMSRGGAMSSGELSDGLYITAVPGDE